MNKVATIIITTKNKKWWQFWKRGASMQTYSVPITRPTVVLDIVPPVNSVISVTYNYGDVGKE